MRKSLLMLATLAPLAGLAGIAVIALPAVAESDDGACITLPAAGLPASGPLDLDAIPTKPVTGPLSVRGVGDDDECDDESGLQDDDGHAAMGSHEDDHGGEHHDDDGEDHADNDD